MQSIALERVERPGSKTKIYQKQKFIDIVAETRFWKFFECRLVIFPSIRICLE